MGVELLEHNQRAYDEVKKLYEQGNRAAVIHPTGSGKSFIALKLIEENKDKQIDIIFNFKKLNDIGKTNCLF